eukprot:2020876-Alexandrium_andersonii.AAC.1
MWSRGRLARPAPCSRQMRSSGSAARQTLSGERSSERRCASRRRRKRLRAPSRLRRGCGGR